MKRILRSRLPERWAPRVPPLLIETIVAIGIGVAMAVVRILITPWASDQAPFAPIFIAAIAATVLAGWRSGILAIAIGQLLIWYFVVRPAGTLQLEDQARWYGLAISTLSELTIVAIIALYQREVDRAWSRREAQVDLMQQALAEIDHRTTNNYQTVLALVQAQANRAEGPVRQALTQVADRIEAIAMVSKQMALKSDSLEKIRLTEYLSELCKHINRGLTRPGVSLECHSDELSLDAEKAVAISIIINELVTNALKHAFPDDREGRITVSLKKSARRLQLEVEDNGVGIRPGSRGRGNGLGTRLINAFVKQLGADYRASSDEDGTRHLVSIPA